MYLVAYTQCYVPSILGIRATESACKQSLPVFVPEEFIIFRDSLLSDVLVRKQAPVPSFWMKLLFIYCFIKDP